MVVCYASRKISVCGGVVKRVLLVLAVMAGSGCAWMHPKPMHAPVLQSVPVPDPDVVERDLSKPYADLSTGGAL